jgi:hypothetical protein
MKTNRDSWRARTSILLGLAFALANGTLAHDVKTDLSGLCSKADNIREARDEAAASQLSPEKKTVEAIQKFGGELSFQTPTAPASPIQIGGGTKKDPPIVEQKTPTDPRGVLQAEPSRTSDAAQKTLTEVLRGITTDQRKSGQGSTTPKGAARRESLSLQPTREHSLGLHVIYDTWWEQGIDSNGDGYTEARMLYTDVDATDGGSHTIYLKIYYKLASSSTWSLYFTTPNYLITADSGNDAIWVAVGSPNQELSMNVYDFKVEVYETGNPVIAVTGDPSTDSDLNDELFETAAEDQRVGMPVISPNSGSIPVTATITCSTVGAAIRYTLDGTDPTSSSTLYSSPIQISTGSNVVLKARGFKSGITSSAVATATYTSSLQMPTATTLAATLLAAAAAQLNGSVNPNGTSTTYYFEYGTTASYGTQTTSASAGSGSTALSVSATLSGLTPGTTYHFRIVATNGAGVASGTDLTFVTVSIKNVTVSAGWNIIAVPVLASDMSVSALFPDAIPPAYGFNNGYVSATTLTAGKGYWLKFPTAKTYAITGAAVRPPNIGVNAGWNMIGPFDFDYATASITPLSLIVTPYYGYSNGYTTATTLTSGKGYWVKTSAAGTLSLQAPSGKLIGASGPVVGESNAGSLSVEIKDNSGNSCTLYLAESAKGSELPPPPPQGIFDVRFASNAAVENIGVDQHEIVLSSVNYPVRVVVRGTNGMQLWLADDRGGTLVRERLEEGKEVMITQKLGKIVLSEKIQAAGTPQQYELSQNYPNPFNPTTVIRFALPKSGQVHLSVVNVLGETVAELVKGELSPGNHQVELNAGGLPSGMYFYRLEAGSFVAVKKLVVVK